MHSLPNFKHSGALKIKAPNHLDYGDLVKRVCDGCEGYIIQFGDEFQPWWEKPISEKNKSKIKIRWIPSQKLSWISRSTEGSHWVKK